MDLLAAVPDEAQLHKVIISRVKWSGDEEKHAAKGLGLILAWMKARQRMQARESTQAKRAAGAPTIRCAPIVAERSGAGVLTFPVQDETITANMQSGELGQGNELCQKLRNHEIDMCRPHCIEME